VPNWKKLITSGSDASLNSLQVNENVIASSFTGSFNGDGNNLTNIGISSLNNITTEVSSSSTDNQIPTAKAVEDRVNQAVTEAGAITGVDAGLGISGGGSSGNITLTLQTGSLHFTDGIKQKLDIENVVSSSFQIINLGFNTTSSFNSYTSSVNLEQSTQNYRLGELETESGSIRSEFTSYTSSLNNQQTIQYGRLDSLETESGSIRTDFTDFTQTYNTGSFSGSLDGNASTATILQTARTINGTSFNGSQNITTTNWGTSRTITIGTTGKSVNGGSNVTWTLPEIGAEPSFSKNTAFNKNFGTISDTVTQGNDIRLSDAREWTASTVSQLEAETGTSTTRRAWTSQRVRQGTLSWWSGSDASTKLSGIESGAQVNVDPEFSSILNKPTLVSGSAQIDYNGIQNTPDLSVLEEVNSYNTLGDFPVTGEANKVYIAIDTGFMYRWSGTEYIQLTDQTAIWGQISGTLSNQTDLQNELNGKANVDQTMFVGTTSIPINRTSASQTLSGVSISGNAGTSTVLQTARTINGTSFDGSAGITTSTWGTARNITIGGTTRSVNGSTTYAWTLGDIGVNNNTLTLATSGIATGSDTWTANQGVDSTFTVNVPGTNISEGTRTTTTVPIASSTGTNATLSAVSTTLAGVMTSSDKTKLDGIATSADNYSSWNLKTNGTQRITIGSGGDLDIVQGTNITVTYPSPGVVNISSTDTNTTYSAGTGITLSGTTFSLTDEQFTTILKNKLDGIEAGAQVNVATNLGSSGTGGTRTITSSTGTDTSITYTVGDLGAVPTTRTITINSGDGLSGGAGQTLAGDRTWNLTVDSTVVRTSGIQTIGGVKTFSSDSIFSGNVSIGNTQLSNQQNIDVDTGALRVIATIPSATYSAGFFDFVISKGSNLRAGTVYSVHDGTTVEFTETSTQDIGDTAEVVLSVDLSGGNLRLLAETVTNEWVVKTLTRGL